MSETTKLVSDAVTSMVPSNVEPRSGRHECLLVQTVLKMCVNTYSNMYMCATLYTHTHKDTHTQRHVSRIAKLGNRNPQQLGNNSCILILSLLTYLRLFSWHNSPWWTSASSLSRLHVHAQTHHTW